MGYNPQESLENTINTMGTLLGVHPTAPWVMGVGAWCVRIGGGVNVTIFGREFEEPIP